jgi:acid phosphatase (class A)
MKRAVVLFFVCLAIAFPLPVAAAHFLVPDSIEPQKLIPPPPAADSLVEHAEIEVILNLQLARTPAQVARARQIQNEDVFVFGSDVLGNWFAAANLPKTAKFFAQLREDFTPVGHLTKKTFNRRRPPFQDARIKPCVEFSDTSSYPSGHATQSAMWATLLGEIFPDHTGGFAARAAETRWYRVVGGAHHPPDVEAGRVLGEAEAQELLKNPAVQKVIAELQAEAAHFLHKKAA